MALSSLFDSSSNEQKWIKEIKNIIKEEVKVDIEDHASIFRVPAALSTFKPEAYTPQLIGLGPYHHFRPELYEMERYKLVIASQFQKNFNSLEFEQLVEKLMEFEYKIRACYHKFLDHDRDTLLWIMAIDGLFLLKFFHIYIYEDDAYEPAHLVEIGGRKLSHDAIVGDIMMLENQIPFLLLSKIFSIQFSDNLDDIDNMLPSTLMTFCKAISPLKLKEDIPLPQVVGKAHLLELLYDLTVPKLKKSHEPSTTTDENSTPKSNANLHGDSGNNSFLILVTLWNMLSKLNIRLPSKITKPMDDLVANVRKIINLPVPGMSNLASKCKETIKPETEVQKPPLQVEKIMIPSASHLSNVAGVEFCPSTGDITTIRFDEKEKKFYLPVITLNVHSEVIMRNLVAYEASTVSESLVFTGYTGLLNGILETVEDAKLLRKKKIIVNKLKSDDEVLQVFNGMSKSIRLTHVPCVDEAIEDVKKFFYNSWRVRAYKSIKKYVYGSWKIFILVASILLMLLMALQSFCSVYNCPQIVNRLNTTGHS